MCYRVSVKSNLKKIEEEFQAPVAEPELFTSYFHVSGFDKPFLPVMQSPGSIHMLQWKSHDKFNTLNAKSETLFDKYYRKFAGNRCLIITTGFFEHRDFNKKKYPYYIKPKVAVFFAVGGIILDQNNFSVITTDANKMLEEIHNSASRMPLIIPREKYATWLRADLTKDEAQSLMVPFDDSEMEAYTCSRIITAKGVNTNCEEAIERVDYPELNQKPLSLF
jgi:putative SOS response-associated peptidase YedK